MLTLEQLQQFRDKLVTSRMSGVLSITDQNGERIEYKTDAQMAAAIAACDRELAALSGRPARTIVFRTSKFGD